MDRYISEWLLKENLNEWGIRMVLDTLYLQYSKELRSYAKNLSGVSEAEDLVQETFIKAMANLDVLKTIPENKKRAWLYQVLKNSFIDRKRKDKSNVSLETCHEPSYEEDIFSKLEVQQLMSHLSPELQDIVFKKYWMGMTSVEIAKSLSIPPGTVRYRLHNAIKIMRNKKRRRKYV
ncbi:RNA polymerase sigma factor [Proteinivorax tanatarense]|uniref:RNA polymerase sigma factor n=1 Tax=Proteinivorax tanatarense TaxID=1260629 RepID=A0AAU7VPM0_9FIRM